ncbi:chromate transporter [Ammoniphilus sp. CFH 90114]|uniref:chromate transporter n=1 Tax=Ammoniphilus sp. CFH 90114 TaxID=2493665 RepID=UPI00100EDE45|nr:chromate transporter [Ammoniphilus sp. CFH 90114]RXT04851.1 chromate transporter [Ammoniphilus sp. CFH 90114]
MIYLQLFWAFFISNILGYGGGPPSIPLIQAEVVDHYGWLTLKEFGDILAIGNALPGPIATKMAAFVGFQVGGVLGAAIALIATVVPSAMAMIILFKFVALFKDSPYVKEMTKSVQPVVAVLLGVLAYQFFIHAFHDSGMIHTAILAIGSFVAMELIKIHPSFVIAGSLAYGAILLS